MNISGIVKSSLIDYPGLISCVLFVPGCNYNCFYCHNRSLIDGTHILLTPNYVTDFLKRRSDLLDGVVVSGGEPTLQNDLVSFLLSLKLMGYKVKLDTNGSRPDIVKEILKLGICDYFAVDYKAPAEQYSAICGRGADPVPVLETIGLLMEGEIPFEVRTTVIPQLGTGELIAMAKEIPKVPRYVLNRYKVPDKYLPRDEERILARQHTSEEIQSLADSVTVWQPNIVY
jgi:pyruvate formate lyase activating enzyme